MSRPFTGFTKSWELDVWCIMPSEKGDREVLGSSDGYLQRPLFRVQEDLRGYTDHGAVRRGFFQYYGTRADHGLLADGSAGEHHSAHSNMRERPNDHTTAEGDAG